ncbi:hypothetical protein NE237_013529 [Protea cynaroides]|uniref:Uncharacterized protein n=1 Tax=Protea cynaroides TaxID=273540 RepID=A0A9Q0JYM3_9MAGN|nr:hypothetical protein NE237_013529 [Protea cynaroides]
MKALDLQSILQNLPRAIPDLGFSSGDVVSYSTESSIGVDSDVYSAKSFENQQKLIVQMPASPEEESSTHAEPSSDTQLVAVVFDSKPASANENEIHGNRRFLPLPRW